MSDRGFAVATRPPVVRIAPEALGSSAFRKDYGIKYAYLSGAMYKGIASRELVVAMGKAGLMGYFGAGGVSPDAVEAAIVSIRSQLDETQSFGMNLLADARRPEREARTVDLYLKHGVRYVEAAAYIQLSPSVVRYRLAGLRRSDQGAIECRHRVLAKVSRPEVAETFMRPAPPQMVTRLRDAGQITAEQAAMAHLVPVAQDICVEADSGGHTDRGAAYALMPAMQALRSRVMREQQYQAPIHIGAAGGIGTPEAAAAAYMLGADFIVTGSVNQCTVEAGTSDLAKDMLQDINVQDTDYAPAGDMFELGAKVQVLKKGVFFAVRGNKLYELYMRHDSIEEIDAKTKTLVQEKYFRQSFAEVWSETRRYYEKSHPQLIEAAERNPKQKMAMIFKWYFAFSNRMAMQGRDDRRGDFQIQCGPALGAFNQWVKGSPLESWRNRHVAAIGEAIMTGAAQVLTERLAGLLEPVAPDPLPIALRDPV